MSYILDALRRADLERERGAVPDLRAQPVPPSAAPDALRVRERWWIGLVMLLGVAAISGVVWWTMSDRSSSAIKVLDQSGPAVTRTLQGPTPPSHEPVSGSAPTLPAPRPEAAPPVIVLALPNAAVAPVPERRPVSGATQPNTTGEQSGAAPTHSPAARTVPGSATRVPGVAPTVTPGAVSDRVFSLSELPDDVRRGLPLLTVSGATYSETPAHRMLIINGQVIREGEEPAPSVILERIYPKFAILRYKGVRYSVPY